MRTTILWIIYCLAFATGWMLGSAYLALNRLLGYPL